MVLAVQATVGFGLCVWSDLACFRLKIATEGLLACSASVKSYMGRFERDYTYTACFQGGFFWMLRKIIRIVEETAKKLQN